MAKSGYRSNFCGVPVTWLLQACFVSALLVLGTCDELLKNGDAEASNPPPANTPEGCADPAQWTRAGYCQGPLLYGTSPHLSTDQAEALKPSGGISYFYGGCIPGWWNAYGRGGIMEQVVRVPAWALKAGNAPRVSLSGYLGGQAGNEDTMLVTSEFLDSDPAVNQEAVVLGKLQIGPVRNKERRNKTAMVFKRQPGKDGVVLLPKGSKFVRTRVVCLNFRTPSEGCCDGYADNLSLKIQK